MKRTPLKFNQVPRFAEKIQSRRIGNVNFLTAAYKEDGEADDDTPEGKLLVKIQQRVAKELETRGLANKDAVTAIVTEQMKDLPLEALRSYAADTEKLNNTVKKIAGEIEKVRNLGIGNHEGKVDAIRTALQSRMTDIQALMTAKKGSIEFNVRAAVVMTTENTIDETDVPEDIIESFSMGAYVPKRYGFQFIGEIADRVTVDELEKYKTWLEEGDTEGAFAIVAEGGLKPLVSTTLVRNVAEAQKIAGKYVITEEFAKFRKNALKIVRQIIQDQMYRDYDAILTANLNAVAVGYTGTSLDGTIIAPNDYDAIGAVAAQIESLNFMPDVLVINPQDKWRIRLSKDSEGRYLFPVVTENGQTIMLGMRLITSTYQPVGTFTLGESGLFKIEEETITVRIGYGITVTGSNPVTSVVSDFDNNQIRVILETFFVSYLATNHIGSYVTTSFATVKTALTAA